MKSIKYTVRFGLDSFYQALWALKDNRLRTVLSVLGITVGIAAVMAVGAISKSGHYLIFNELETFGLKSIWIFRANDAKDPNRAVRTGTGIDVSDLELFGDACCSAVRRVSPIINSGNFRLTIRNGSRFGNAQITGIGTEFSSINNDNLTAGRYFKTEDILRRRAVALVGPTVVEDLFGVGVEPIGREIRINNNKYLIVGLLERKSRDFLASIGSAGGQDANNRILLPYTTLQAQLGIKDIHVLQAETVDISQADAAVRQITNALERKHNHRYQYKSTTMTEYIATSNRILQGVSLIGIVAASVSLLVGGMGIMNIVSTSVLERTREIGLRKAIGASQRHILFQFLLESVIISAAGGVLGLFCGVVVSFLLAWITGFPLTPSWFMVMISLVVSILVGIFSGYYPARRAAMLRPVIALRYE